MSSDQNAEFFLPKSAISASEQEGINFKTQPLTLKLFVTIYNAVDLFSLYVLFSQYRSRDNTLENRFFQISSYSCAYLHIIYEKTMGQVPLGPLLGKQNIQAKKVFTHVTSIYANFWEQKKLFTQEKRSTPTGLIWNTNMAAVTSCETHF